MISVLYVDDEELLLTLTSVFLKKLGDFRVETATSATAALAMMESGPYDVIVSDYQMPGMDGIEFLKAVRSRYGDCPFILFTGKGREEVVIEAINQGVDFYLQKGGDPRSQFTELAHKITRAAERRGVRDALRRSEEKYRELVENANTIILKMDQSGCITSFNNYAQDFFGYGLAEILGRPVIGTIVPATESGSARDLKALLEDIISHPENHTNNVNENITKDGRRVWIQWWNKPLFDEQGRFEGLLSIGNDITDQRRVQEVVRSHRVLIDNARDSIIFFRKRDGRILGLNRSAAGTYGYSREELLGMTIFDLRRCEESALVRSQLDKAAEEGIIFETVHRKKDGTFFPVDVSSFSQVIDNEPVVISFIRDISQRKRVEDALLQANRKLNLLSSITRHDILNQMMVLDGLLVLIEENLENPKNLAGLIEREKAVARNLNRQILFTKDYEDLGVKTPEWQKIADCLHRSFSTISPKGINLQVTLGGVEIFADPLFEKVCDNLVDNSLRHGGTSLDRIRVSSRHDAGSLVIVYEDNGCGIDPAGKSRLFERGFGKNTGLGLFLSREILAITGISIRETSEPEKGARFEILVPQGAYRMPGQDLQ